MITQRMPNGNLALSGKQEVRVNSELRELVLSGIIRPQDIMSDNTVLHDRMAEARISYGGAVFDRRADSTLWPAVYRPCQSVLIGSVLIRSVLLIGSVLIGSVLIGSVLIGSVLIGSVLIGSVLIGSVLIGSVLIGSVLIGSVLIWSCRSTPTDPVFRPPARGAEPRISNAQTMRDVAAVAFSCRPSSRPLSTSAPSTAPRCIIPPEVVITP